MLNASGITLVIHGLSGGGAEKVAANMANHWAEAGRAVTLITFRVEEGECYRLNPAVERVAIDQLSLEDFLGSNWGREEENIERMRLALRAAGNKKVISFMPKMNIRVLLADEKNEYDIYANEVAYPPLTPISKLDDSLRTLLYNKARAVTVLTESTKTDWADVVIPGSNVEVMAYFIPDKEVNNLREEGETYGKEDKFILSCGRLCAQKQFHLLIEAYARAVAIRPDMDVKLKIAGLGELKDELVMLTERLDITDKVEFIGWIDDVFGLMKKAACYALSSGFEGFPMALLSALSVGTPAVSFDCLTGPAEMIESGKNGILVEQDDVEALAQALVEVCGNEQYRSVLSANAVMMSKRFSQSSVMAAWDKLVFEC